MRKEELIKQLQEHEPLLANAVCHMVEYIQGRYPAAYPSKAQTEAVNDYLRSVYADGDGSMSESTTGSIICRREDVEYTADFLFWLHHL